AAERRGTNAVGGARRTDRGRVVGPGIGVGTGGGRIGAVGEGFTVTGGLEVGGVLGRGLELRHVHRIGVFGAGRHVGDLPLFARVADRDGVGAVAVRARTQCHAVVGIGHGAGAQRHAVGTVGRAEIAHSRAVRAP